MKNYKTIIAAVVAGVALTAVTSQATITVIAQPNAEVAPATYGANILATLVSPYAGVAPFSGTFTSWVIAAGADPIATANGFTGLTFVFQASSTAGVIESISVNGVFGNIGATYVPVNAVHPIAGTGVTQSAAGVVKVNWPAPDGYNGAGDYVYIYTQARGFTTVFESVQDGSSDTPKGLAPVPEPSTVVAGALMLLPFGIGAIRSLRKDRTA